MGRMLITNPLCVATMDEHHREFSGGHVLIEDHRIASAGPEPYPHPVESVIDAAGMVVLPGFVNTHHHLFQSLTRNVRRMQQAPLFDWLVNHYEIWRHLTESAAHASAKTALLELMKSGVTLSADHFYLFPNRASDHLIDAEIRAARELGLRFHPTRGSMTLGQSEGGLPPDDIVQTDEEVLEDAARLIEQHHDPSEGSMLRISLAPCAPFNVTRHLLERTVQLAEQLDLRIHTHLAETLDEERYCLDRYSVRPVEYVEALGWLSDRAWFAHAIHLTDEEVRKFGEAKVGVAHCPASNLRLGSGIARIKELSQSGARVGIGVDGSASNDSSNMLAEIRNALQLSRLRERDLWLTPREVLRAATRGGAEVLGHEEAGSLEVGKVADLALFSLDGIEYAGALSDPLAALVFCVRTSPVDHLIVHGNHVIRDGVANVDERAVVDRHNRIAEDILDTACRQSGVDFRKDP